MGDVNGLKITNDIFGHAEGDKLLKTISKILIESCRTHDIIARWGGDEFSIILPKTDYQTALKVDNKIKKTCNDTVNSTVNPSIALGLDTKEDASQSLITVIKKAEGRMYRNKLLESKSKQNGTVASLQRTLFEKSYETEEHALRVIDISQKIGRALGLHENDMDDLQLLASLHDIGKVAISDIILAKPGKLTEDEWEEMKRHSEIGYRIAQSAFELSHISEYILCHHERWDGTGYPQGRKGEEIPLLSRIISIADAYDVMTNIRSYKNKMTVEQSLEEIRRCSGTQFDPALVGLFLILIVPKE
jgi:diguanylate cyclase (GGDEF)-like protein